MTRAFVIAARRTAVVPRGGAFRDVALDELGAAVLRAVLADAGLGGEAVDEVIVANAIGEGGNPARRIALLAGLPERVAGLTVDRQCAGGLDALLLARALVAAGADVVVAGGAESYSRRPERRMPWADAPYEQAPFTPWPERDPDMAEAADALARRLGLSRDRMDAFAVASHARALAARGRLRAEIVPVAGVRDDAFARVLTPELAARAKGIAGAITAANAAVAADGAALCLVVSERVAARAARAVEIVAGVTLGGDPVEPATAPVAAIAKAMADAGLTPSSLDRCEVMEAYAAQAIACIAGAGLDPLRVNLAGGALARGHPVGASGAVLAVRLFCDLQGGHGLAAIAAAGGIGTALVLRG